MSCSECKNTITNKEWQICLKCGQKHRSFYIPKETKSKGFFKPLNSKNAIKAYIIFYLTLQNLIILRDILLKDETIWWSFTLTTLGSITMHILICKWILKR